MGILDEIQRREVWEDFLEYKLRKRRLSRRDEAFLREFIGAEAYRGVTGHITEPDYCFSPPEKRLLNKLGSAKKRVIYSYSDAENTVLKLIAFLLYRYDGLQPSCCYSFRRDLGAKNAIRRMVAVPNVDAMYCYKLDIKNYFNSIDTGLLLPVLRGVLSDDAPLYRFLARLLTADCAVFEGALIHEKRGAMAGTPISPFLANIFLADLDRHFEAEGTPYARYSDDILLLARDEAELNRHREYLADALAERGLEINSGKEKTVPPYGAWEFLGIEYRRGRVDISPATLRKLKGKIRRKARAIRRWKLRKGAGDDHAMRVFARSMNRKLYDEADPERFTWTRWFFPLATVSGRLHEIDLYMQDNMRYIATGRYSKANYRISYGQLKECGYISLVGEYYRFREESRLRAGAPEPEPLPPSDDDD